MTAAIGFLGFPLATGQLLLLAQGTPFQLVRAENETSDVVGSEGSAAHPYLGHVTGVTTPVVKVPRKAGARVEKKTQATKIAVGTGKPRNTAKPSDDILARNKRAVEAHGVKAASQKLGVNYATLYGQAVRYGWTMPARKKQPTGKALEKAAAKEATGALRRCERCEQMTRSNPCQHCGHPWKRDK